MKFFSPCFPLIIGLLLAGCGANTVPPSQTTQQSRAPADSNYANTYDEKTIANAASDFLGGGSEAIAKVVEKAFKDLGQPSSYIIGTEVSGAIGIGVRYGDGILTHKIEGDSQIFWKGPSIGFDLGANGSRVFALVYNLYDAEELYQRYPAVEGSAYFIGGVGMNYQQRGDIIIAPIRVGVGLRLGVSLGYMHLSKKRSWIPF